MQERKSLPGPRSLAVAFALIFTTVLALSQAPVAGPVAKPVACSVHTTPASPADVALANLDFPTAEKLYSKEREASSPAGDRAHLAWISTLLDEGKLDGAEQAAQEWSAKAPNNPWSKVALSLVQLRKGDILAPSAAIQSAFAADPCNSWVRAEFAHVLAIDGMVASSGKMMDEAHRLAPDDLQIELQWLTFPRVRVDDLTQFIARSDFLTSDQRAILESLRDRNHQFTAAPCRLVTPLQSTSVPYRAIQNGPNAPIYWGLDVGFNGKSKRLEIDTGKSGLIVNKDTAESLHLPTQTYQTVTSTGHPTNAVVAKVNSIKIGELEFSDCTVKVVETSIARGPDGVIGTDVFHDFLLTLDYPGHSVKVSSLPPVLGAPQTAESLYAGDASSEPDSHDRYVDPSMQTWVKAFRQGSQLSVLVSIDKGPQHLFRLATGAQLDWVSPAEPHQVQTLQRDDGGGFPVNGLTRLNRLVKVDRTGQVDLYFGGLMLHEQAGMISFNGHNYPGGDLLGVYGILGQQSLELMTLSIDYRDSLVRFEYDPKRIVRCGPGINMPGCF